MMLSTLNLNKTTMHSLRKMAAVSYIPSIHDKTAENKKLWAHFDPEPRQLNSLTKWSTTDSLNEDHKDGAEPNSAASLRVEAEAALSTLSCLAVPDYRPLDAFSAPGPTAEDPGSGPWSEADDICEVSIRLKEIELCNMMEETPGIPEYISPRKIKTYWVAPTRRKPAGRTRRRFY